MAGSKTFKIRLTLEQKTSFNKWLVESEKALRAELEGLEALRSQIEDETKTGVLSKKATLTHRSQSLTSRTIDALNKMGKAQTSVAIISWLMQEDKELNQKGKRYVTKIVTSKLSLLVDKGKIEKTVVEGKNYYSLKSQD